MPATGNGSLRTPAQQRGAGDLVKAVALVVLLVGSLLPSPVPLVTVAAVTAAPFVLWNILRGFPVIPKIVCFSGVVAAIFGIAAYLGPRTGQYGQDKIYSFFTITLFTAVAAILITDEERLTTWAKVWVLSGVLLSALALTGAADAAGRAVGADGNNPIWLGRAIGSPAVGLIWLMYRQAIPRAAGLAAGTLLGAGLLATGSRGPLVALALGAVVVVSTAASKGRFTRVAVVAVIGLVTLYSAVSFGLISSTTRIGAFISDPNNPAYSSDRVQLAEPTVQVIAAHPFGVGMGNWAEHVTILAFKYPHNLWLEVLCESGWILGGAFICMVGHVLTRLWKASKQSTSAALLLAYLSFEMVSVSVSGDLNARTFFFMLTLGYAVTLWPRSAWTPPAAATAEQGPLPVGIPTSRLDGLRRA